MDFSVDGGETIQNDVEASSSNTCLAYDNADDKITFGSCADGSYTISINFDIHDGTSTLQTLTKTITL